MGERRRDRKQRRLTRTQIAQTDSQIRHDRRAAFHAAQQAAVAAQQNDMLIAQQHQQLQIMQAQMAAAIAAQQGPGQWAPDPSGRFAKRYHDGQRWTQWVIDGTGERSIDPVPEAAVTG